MSNSLATSYFMFIYNLCLDTIRTCLYFFIAHYIIHICFMLHYIIAISIGQFNWQRRKWVLTTGLNWVKPCWESSAMLLAIGILHFHCTSHLPTVRPSASLCLLLPVAVPVSGRIIRWLSAFALIYEESATSDHSISSSVGNTGGTGKGWGQLGGRVQGLLPLPLPRQYLHFVCLSACPQGECS